MSKKNIRHSLIPLRSSSEELLRSRLHSIRRRGNTRKILVFLREHCLKEEHTAWLWTLYGVCLGKAGYSKEACMALRHALWLRRNAGDDARVRSTQVVLEHMMKDISL